jgi:hypothetical protein
MAINKSKMKCNKPRRTPDGPKKFVVKACEGGKDKICLYADGSGLICDPELVIELGLPQFITMPNMRALADELSQTK